MLETYASILVIKELLPLIFLVLAGYAYLNAYCADLLYQHGKSTHPNKMKWHDWVLDLTISVYRYLYYKATKQL